jgi:hypothetical protein
MEISIIFTMTCNDFGRRQALSVLESVVLSLPAKASGGGRIMNRSILIISKGSKGLYW